MARISRTCLDHSCYHIMVRGNQKMKVFQSDTDYGRYLNMLKRAKKRYKISLYAYCLMPNHVHLLIETSKVLNMSNFMHWVNRGYTSYYNAKYNKVGHLWQGRFKSKPIIKGQYLINCSNYIEANPVRAEIVNEISEYKWSSYQERCFTEKQIVLDEIRIDCRYTPEGTPLILGMGTL